MKLCMGEYRASGKFQDLKWSSLSLEKDIRYSS